MQTQISVYIQPKYEKFWEQLEEKAENEDRSLSYLVNEAVKKYINKEADD